MRGRATVAISCVLVLLLLLGLALREEPVASFTRAARAWMSEHVVPAREEDRQGERELRLTPVPAALISAPLPDPRPIAPGQARALAYSYDSRIYAKPARKPRATGLVRRGTVLAVRGRVPGPGCKGGAWYALPPAGVVCSNDGFAITGEPIAYQGRQRRPHRSRALPFSYGKVNRRDALRFYRIPTAEEEQAIAAARAADQKLPDVVSRVLDGVYLTAIDRTEHGAGGEPFYRTVRGRYVRARFVDEKPAPAMHGELLGERFRLPLAFVYGSDEVPLLARSHGGTVEVGVAYKHARFNLIRVESWAGREVALGEDGVAVAREHVRIARARERPSRVTAHERWIHVDLDEQALIAYEGDHPVFATLVSSGKDGYDTPAGSFRVREKHVTVTMRGEDPADGRYEVEEVPWTLYYHDSYALHGAYWHDDFGQTRSHGCTNIAPIDARWLFHFTSGELPAGWHARRHLEGTRIEITRLQPAEPSSS